MSNLQGKLLNLQAQTLLSDTQPPIAQFSSGSTRQLLSAGTILTQQDTRVAHVHYIEVGVVLQTGVIEGGSHVAQRILGPGACIGAASALLDRDHISSTVTIKDTIVWTLTADQFRCLHATSAPLARWTSLLLSLELHSTVEQNAILREPTARTKVETFLLWMLHRFRTEDNRIDLPLDHADAAELVNLTPEHYNKVMNQMQTEGVLLRRQDAIEILRPELLRVDRF